MTKNGKLRKLQNWSANRNWRIDYIFYPADKGMLVTGIKNPMGVISIVGMLLFLGGFTYIMIRGGELVNIKPPVSVCLFGFAMAAVGSIFHEKIRKRNWPTIAAKVLDYETQSGRTPQNHSIWAIRALCKFEIDDKEITCTPEITWPKRRGEAWKNTYIEEMPDGSKCCHLLVNPENPHETYLVAAKQPTSRWSQFLTRSAQS